MHATHRFFMTKRSMYILTLDARTYDRYGESELEYWLKLINSYAGSAPIIVVLNKCDLHKVELPTLALKRKYENIKDFIYALSLIHI